MSKKKRIIITVTIAILVIGGAIAATLGAKKHDESPTSPVGTQQPSASTDESTDDPDGHDDHTHEAGAQVGTDVHTHDIPELVVNGSATTNSEVDATYRPLAEKAVYAYVFQRTSESATDRQARLRQAFTATSPVITAPKPKVDLSNSANITANPIILSSQWAMNGETLVFSVSVRVIVRSDTPPHDEVSDIYQVYDVRFANVNDTYKPHTVTFSKKPVILSR